MKYSTEKLTQKAYIYGGIFSLANRMQSLGDRRDEAVTTKQWFAMANIALAEDFEFNVKELSHVLGTSSQNTKKMLDLLVRKGYVLLQKDESDSRNIRISLTEDGKKYYGARAKRESIYLDYLFDGLSETQIETVYDSLKLLSSNILAKEDV